jgi:UDP-N-acetylglucosamine--N-acetylmuramyl-(pentapeptide) pyrophosphoryl-undecaprenol N-acetylglucosamine transferase
LRVLFAGGGTAGHINPALAIAGEMAGDTILFVGTEKGMESQLIPRAGFEIKYIDVTGFDRENVLKNFMVLAKIPFAEKAAGNIIKDFAPDVVVGTGGYVAGPVLLAAHMSGIRTLIHEVNAVAGVTTKLLAKFADVVTVSFPATISELEHKAKRIEVTGNPIRSEIFTLKKEDARRKLQLDARPLVVAFGGSLGAESINSAMEKWVKSPEIDKYQVIWATGERYFQNIIADIGARDGVQIVPYISNVYEVLPAADVIVTRGGGALFEIAALGKASVIVPSPNVTNNHQEHNARAMEKEGAAAVVLESDIDRLSGEIERLCRDSEARFMMEVAAEKMGKRDAAGRIVGILREEQA